MRHLEVVKLGVYALMNQLRRMSNVDKTHTKECELAHVKDCEWIKHTPKSVNWHMLKIVSWHTSKGYELA